MGPIIHRCKHCDLTIYEGADDRWWHSGTLIELRKASSLAGVKDTHQAELPTFREANLSHYKDENGTSHIRYDG